MEKKKANLLQFKGVQGLNKLKVSSKTQTMQNTNYAVKSFIDD